jgi:exoribonuclease R
LAEDLTQVLEREFEAIRAELGVPADFPAAALRAAEEAAAAGPADAPREDMRDIPFVTIDPPLSRDLDQAFYAERRGGERLVFYAIADISAAVPRGSPIEEEAWRRGVTLYSPDRQTPLYPPVLSQGLLSLLPEVDRPAILFTLSLDGEANARLVSVGRALVRSRAKLSYEEVSEHLRDQREGRGGALAGQEWSGALTLLEEIGRARQRLEVLRGAVSLPLKAQHVSRSDAALTGYALALEDPNDVEGWNAQISLMTGMAAASLMLERGVGLLRSLDPPREDRLSALRLTAAALRIPWPEGASYGDFLRSLDPTRPLHAAILFHCAAVMTGARYMAFRGEPPEGSRHAAISAYYAHVTAPLRRLADRYVLDLLIALSSGGEAEALAEPLPRLPPVMQGADKRAKALEAAIVDFAEARLLHDRVGEDFEALVIRLKADRVTVQLADPPVRADVPAERFAAPDVRPRLVGAARLELGDRAISLGQRLTLRLVAADPPRREISFSPAP